ncbi:MAG: sodium-dependent bicarbonate transport family permease [Myxococcota bacterium]
MDLDAALATLLSPVVLFFALGFGAGLGRSSLAVPEQVAKGLSLYLMLAIGFKGGVEMGHAGLDPMLLKTVVAGLVAGFGIPVLAYGALRKVTQLGVVDAASVAAHYGSISVVTFVAATDHVARLGVGYEGFIVAIVALMETPAIIAGLVLARRDQPKRARRHGGSPVGKELLREVFLNGSVVLLLGSLAIGALTGDEGFRSLEPFIVSPFKGVLCLFLLDMGVTAAQRLRDASEMSPRLVTFGLVMPLVGGLIGLGLAALAGLDVGTGTLFVTLCGSASYIAVPAAMRIALPKANPAYSLGLSLGITFPFNLTVGIPLYAELAERVLGGA